MSLTPMQAEGRIVSATARIAHSWEDMTAPVSKSPGGRHGGATLDDDAESDADVARLDRAIQARLDVEGVLFPWCQVVTEAREGQGMECTDRPLKAHGPTMAGYIGRHVSHLVNELIDAGMQDAVDELERMASVVERFALPDHPRRLRLGECTAVADERDCGGVVRTLDEDASQAVCGRCGASGSTAEWREWIAPVLPAMTARELCDWLHETHALRIKPVAIRARKHRGSLSSIGRRGDADLFDPIAAWHEFRDTRVPEVA